MCLIRVSWTGKMFFALLIILSADAHWILLKLEIYSFHSSHAPITVLRFLIHSNYQVIIHPLCGSCISFIKGQKFPAEISLILTQKSVLQNKMISNRKIFVL